MIDGEYEFGLAVTTAAAVEPVSLEEAKTHLNITHDSDDAQVSWLISAARRACEHRCRRAFVNTKFLYSLPGFPCLNGGRILLPRPRLQSVQTVSYLDSSGTRVTLTANTDYIVSVAREPAAIYPAYGTTWPAARWQIDSVQVAYTAGFGAAAENVPEDIIAAIMLMTGHLYERREATSSVTISNVPIGVESLLCPHVVHWAP